MNKLLLPKLSSYFGIVSPCSTCNNKRSTPDPTVPGGTACPRLVAIELKQQLQSINVSTSQVDSLTLTGNEDSGSGNTGFVNPVYSDSTNSVLVWVATLNDNKPIINSNGDIINPGLLSADFDTKYINCREKPVAPAHTEAAYRSQGAWAEKDQLHISIVEGQQSLSSDDGSDKAILLNGFAEKVNFAYSAPRTPVERDYSVAGT